jgi:hypothetical protein
MWKSVGRSPCLEPFVLILVIRESVPWQAESEIRKGREGGRGSHLQGLLRKSFDFP